MISDMADSVIVAAVIPGGRAIDLGKMADRRTPVTIPSGAESNTSDLTFSIWVQADLESVEEYEIASGPEAANADGSAWRLGVQANGAWYWRVETADGVKGALSYHPTPRRQSVRDGDWHLLAFTYNAADQRVELFYDGLNVAIYNLGEMPELQLTGDVHIGGKFRPGLLKWDDFKECDTFYGLIGPAHSVPGIIAERTAMPSNTPHESVAAVTELKVMTFNIYHGGKETGREVGVRRIIEVIKDSGADVICMQETYGSGAQIADALGYYFYLCSTNLSIMSRYPIDSAKPLFHSFHCGTAILQLGGGQEILISSMWLNAAPDYWESDLLRRPQRITTQEFLAGEEGRRLREAREILTALATDKRVTDKIPVLLCGDFNSGSHLDWVGANAEQYLGYTFEWPVSQLMRETGFKDSFRQIYPDPVAERGVTWSPMKKDDLQDRIDYIYYKGEAIEAVASRVIDTHAVRFPSDHAAVMTTFSLT